MSQNSQTILITGCSSGFGLLAAARLASKGHRVIASMRDPDKKDSLLSEINRRGGKVDIIQLDVTDRTSIENAIKQVAYHYDSLDVLVNNAGYGVGGFFEDLTEHQIRHQMETNFFGVQNLIRGIIPLMRPRKKGKIINISSVAGFTTSPAFSAYNASKWALEAFSESLRYELMPFGIQVILVEPGTYKTKIFGDNARYAKNFDNPDSPYFERSQKLRNMVLDYVNNKCKKDPETVAALIEKLIITPKPAFRNIPDFEGRMLFLTRKFLPFNLYSRLIERAF